MQKHIEKLENISNFSNPVRLNNLTIEKIGKFNLFSGKYKNGYDDILTSLGSSC